MNSVKQNMSKQAKVGKTSLAEEIITSPLRKLFHEQCDKTGMSWLFWFREQKSLYIQIVSWLKPHQQTFSDGIFPTSNQFCICIRWGFFYFPLAIPEISKQALDSNNALLWNKQFTTVCHMNRHRDYGLGGPKWIIGYEYKPICNNATSD